MSTNKPLISNKIMILAAGLGTRMRPLTDEIPKPMVTLGGKPLIRIIIEKAAKAGFQEFTINLFYKKEILRTYLADLFASIPELQGKTLYFSEEEERLETGGGLLKALPNFGSEPFFVINSDNYWQESGLSIFEELSNNFDQNAMELQFMFTPKETMISYAGNGDFDIGTKNEIFRGEENPYVMTGAYILSPSFFKKNPFHGAFPLMNLVKHKMENGSKVHGTLSKAQWFYINSLEDLNNAEFQLNAAQRS